MHFTQLSLRNFGPFEKIDLELQRGSIGIFGRNGGGKTTNGGFGDARQARIGMVRSGRAC